MSDHLPGRRLVRSPLTPEMLAPLGPETRWVQFDAPLSEQDHQRLGELVARHPGVGLYAYTQGGEDGPIRRLDFLHHYPTLRRFSCAIEELESFEGLEALSPHLADLALGHTSRPLSVAVLRQLPRLISLHLTGPLKDLDVLSEFMALEELSMYRMTLPDFRVLAPLQGLRSLALALGGARNLSHLALLRGLENLEVAQVRQLEDVSVVGEMPKLQQLSLSSLRNVSGLPSLRRSAHLRRITLQNMKGLRDLSPLAGAPALRELLLIEMGHLEPADLQPLVGHPTLGEVVLGLGSDRKNLQAQRMVPLPSVRTRGWRGRFSD